jgi:hypothetical protein
MAGGRAGASPPRGRDPAASGHPWRDLQDVKHCKFLANNNRASVKHSDPVSISER